MPDPFRARKPDVDTTGLSDSAADLAEKAMPGNTGDTPDSTPGNHVPDQDAGDRTSERGSETREETPQPRTPAQPDTQPAGTSSKQRRKGKRA